MHLKIATLCDSAFEYENKLCLLGTFDIIETDKLPIVKPACSYVFQIVWEKNEEGVYSINVQYENEEGQKTLNDSESKINVEIPKERNTIATNVIINMQQLKFSKAGSYYANIFVDDKKIGTVQLEIIKKEKNKIPKVVMN